MTNAPQGDAPTAGRPLAETPAPASVSVSTSAPAPIPPPAAHTPQTYTVRPGDTLSAIAERHGTSVEAIAQSNHISNPNEIEVGQVLTIAYAPAGTPAAHAGAVAPAPTGPQSYTVQPGDTLSAIAARYATTAEAIAQANDIRDANLIDAGQVLTIP